MGKNRDRDVDAELEAAAELAGELSSERAGELADALDALTGLEPFELAAVHGALVLLREALRVGASTLLAQQAIARAIAELEAAERDLTRNAGHGARRG